MPAPAQSATMRDDALISGLTDEQALAAGTAARGVFIEAGPGTGKTTVAAHRYTALRYRPYDRSDARAIIAVNFTRAATANLRRRVRRFTGPAATAWPHRIITFDTVMSDLLHHLLRTGDVRWPGGLTALKVEDSWNILGETFWTNQTYTLVLRDGTVVAQRLFADDRAARPDLRAIGRKFNDGVCTHGDVRLLVAAAMATGNLRVRLRERLASTVRALIVDEVFDANDLDVAVLRLAAEAGVELTLVGDPWQALYLFRGARPALVRQLISETGLRVLPLTKSFRWRSAEQATVASQLRAGAAVPLLRVEADAIPRQAVDVVLVLGTEWKPLWELGEMVLPLAFRGFKGTVEEAAATILLNHVTRNVLGEDATYLGDALTSLAITDVETPRKLEPELAGILEMLKAPGRPAAATAWTDLTRILNQVSPRQFRTANWRYTDRLQLVAARLRHQHRPVPGLTTHQAKGREWDTVGFRLTDSQAALLAQGLDAGDDTARIRCCNPSAAPDRCRQSASGR